MYIYIYVRTFYLGISKRHLPKDTLEFDLKFLNFTGIFTWNFLAFLFKFSRIAVISTTLIFNRFRGDLAAFCGALCHFKSRDCTAIWNRCDCNFTLDLAPVLVIGSWPTHCTDGVAAELLRTLFPQGFQCRRGVALHSWKWGCCTLFLVELHGSVAAILTHVALYWATKCVRLHRCREGMSFPNCDERSWNC